MVKKIANFIKDNYKYLLFCIVFIICNGFMLYRFRASVGWKILPMGLLIVFQVILCALCFWLYKYKKWQHHQLFLLLSIVAGLLFVFIMPPGAAPDEPNHFRRAYEISEGKFISSREDSNGEGGTVLPVAINELFSVDPPEIRYRDIPGEIEASNNATGEEFQNFGNTALYSPIVYLPQATGILVGRILHLPIIVVFYLARIFNLSFWILLGYYALKKIPFGKNVLLLILFMPISIQAAASCQADALTNVSTIAIFALTLYKIKKPTQLTTKENFAALALALLVSMSKIVYLPFCFFLLLLPKQCFKNSKEKLLRIILPLVAIVLINLAWLAISAGFLVEFMEGVNSGEQVKFILSHPVNYSMIFGNTIISRGIFYFFSFFGYSLSYFTVPLSEVYILFFAFFIFYVFMQENGKDFILSSRQKAYIAAVSAICFILIFTSLYVQWSPLRSALIDGVQGRYFIPLALPVLFLLKPNATRKKEDLELYVFAMIAAISAYASIALVGHFLS